MEVLKIIGVVFALISLIFFMTLFAIGAVLSFRETIESIKSQKKWATEQERARISRDIKLGFCKKCPSRANRINYFGSPCIYNSEWLCEGPPMPEKPITITVTRAKDMVEVTRCKDCVHWENKYCHNLKINVANFDWFCCAGMKRRDK